MTGSGAVAYTCIGVATLLAALLPRLLNRLPISMPMVFLAAGALAFTAIGSLPDPDPVHHGSVTLHLTELCVIISLMGAGLALNRPVGLRRWSTTWRLLAITMPLSVLAIAVLGWGVLGWGVASSVLLAAVVAPTDPVLAGEVQVAEPAENPDDDAESNEDEARFALTSEAGLNDGLAFPFTYAAVAISIVGAAPDAWLPHWLAVDVVWRLAAGLLVGLFAGWVLRKLFFAAPSEKFRLAEHAEGFVALAATFLAYGLTELVGGYGFIAVFVCACTIRAGERSHGYHRVLHQYVEQIERMLTVLIIFLLGGAAVTGLLAGTRWQEVLVALLILLVVRPVTGLVALARGKTGPRERFVISFFGVRGVGSLFYVAYALQAGQFAEPEAIWRVVGLVVIGSIVLHGVTATPAIRLLDRLRLRAARDRHGDPAQAPQTPV
ncbi:cation:proton antiporter [Actinosynnema sp. NPDC047251]|uniref:NhaP-type Na+(K+)/H+ antiporter n=1 Tax=Saccharothrix espanaensis (strain ATCC 51144 / DSM 44229 / JCM 9112 / NBRC 15066 / NRRL 15764) TaxID=1179773 RepID=K0K7Q6_SACES|nr:cation:proton antiporter [Saccharothrix espanaensis]CCH32648.1 NhaP-type Na+(K+)/H+ antiporter [Saccharothrix espanaensis DSM 44229]